MQGSRPFALLALFDCVPLGIPGEALPGNVVNRVTAFSTAGSASAVALLVKAKKRLVGLLLVYTGANALIPVRVIDRRTLTKARIAAPEDAPFFHRALQELAVRVAHAL